MLNEAINLYQHDCIKRNSEVPGLGTLLLFCSKCRTCVLFFFMNSDHFIITTFSFFFSLTFPVTGFSDLTVSQQSPSLFSPNVFTASARGMEHSVSVRLRNSWTIIVYRFPILSWIPRPQSHVIKGFGNNVWFKKHAFHKQPFQPARSGL